MIKEEFIQIITAISQMKAYDFGNLTPVGPYVDAVGVAKILQGHLDIHDYKKFTYDENTRSWIYHP